jgi:hypothetical protein
MQKTIICPEPVILLGFDGQPLHKDEKQTMLEEPFDMKRVFNRFVFLDKKIGLGRKAGQFVARCNKALDSIVGNVLTLDEADYVLVKDIIQNPTDASMWPPPVIVSQLEDFFIAIEVAT